MANEEIKKYAKSKKVYLWEVAEKLGLWDSNFPDFSAIHFLKKRQTR